MCMLPFWLTLLFHHHTEFAIFCIFLKLFLDSGGECIIPCLETVVPNCEFVYTYSIGVPHITEGFIQHCHECSHI